MTVQSTGACAADRQGQRQRHQERGEVARDHRRHRRPVLLSRRAHPAEPADGEGPEETAGQRQQVAPAPGRARSPRADRRSTKNSASPESDGGHEAEVLAADPLLEQPGAEHQQVQRRGGLQKDGVGRGREPVGQHEQREARGVGEARPAPPAASIPAAPRASSGAMRERRDTGPEAGDLPAAELGGLDGGPAGAEQDGGGRELQARTGTGGHGAK